MPPGKEASTTTAETVNSMAMPGSPRRDSGLTGPTSSTTTSLTSNTIRIFFRASQYKQQDAMQMAKLALKSVEKDMGSEAKQIYIRADNHPTTEQSRGKIKGWHLTVHYKSAAQIESGTHMSVHTFTHGKGDLNFKEDEFFPEEDDYNRKKRKWTWRDLTGPKFVDFGDYTPDQLRL